MTAKEAINILEPIRRSSAETSTGGFEHRPIVYALQTAIEALEKQIPKKPKVSEDKYYSGILEYRCPVCNAYFGKRGKNDVILFRKEKYCDCGQAIDWSEVEK